MKTVRVLSGNTLKIIAAILMVVDHAALLFFPESLALRCIGRLSMPIFAFMIAEGCHYTRNRVRYVLGIAGLALICQTAYYVYDKSLYMTILVNFSMSCVLVYILQEFYKGLFGTGEKGRDSSRAVLWGGALVTSVAAVALLNVYVDIDYGFWGCLMPLFASLPRVPEGAPQSLRKLDNHYSRVLCMGICVLIFAITNGGFRYYALLALPLLLLYSEKRGKLKMKYFFYVFYPAHLLLLMGIYMLIDRFA